MFDTQQQLIEQLISSRFSAVDASAAAALRDLVAVTGRRRRVATRRAAVVQTSILLTRYLRIHCT